METTMNTDIDFARELTAVGGKILDLIDGATNINMKYEEIKNESARKDEKIKNLENEVKTLKLKLAMLSKTEKTQPASISDIENFAQKSNIKMHVVAAVDETAAAPVANIEEKKQTIEKIEDAASAVSAVNAAATNVEAPKPKNLKSPSSFKAALQREEKEKNEKIKGEMKSAEVAMRLQELENPGIKIEDPRPFTLVSSNREDEVVGGFNPVSQIIKWVNALKTPSKEGEITINYPTQFTCDKSEDDGAYNLCRRIGGMVHRINEFVKDAEKDGDIMLNDGEMTIDEAKKLIFGNLKIDQIFKNESLGEKNIFVLSEGAIAEFKKIRTRTRSFRACLLMGQYINKVINPELSA